MISIRDLYFSYPQTDNIINGVSLDFLPGKYYCLIGPNGSGKSTLARLVAGLLEPQSGEIVLDGLVLSRKDYPRLREAIGIVFQNPDNQFIGASVADDIAFGLENRRVDPALMPGIIQRCADAVGMGGFLDREPTQLSGGQKQRVAIAGMIALDPRIIIFDEATSMLDPKGRQEVNQLVAQLRQDQRRTIISITHDIEEAALADELIIIDQGVVVARGTPAELFASVDFPSHNLDYPFIIQLERELRDLGVDEQRIAEVVRIWRSN